MSPARPAPSKQPSTWEGRRPHVRWGSSFVPGALAFALVLSSAPAVASKVAPVESPASVRPKRRWTVLGSLQQQAERLLQLSRAPEGAILVSDVRTGRLLVWASLGKEGSRALPMAPSASLFKLATATALLDHGHVRPQTRACYGGGIRGIQASDLVAHPNDDRCVPFFQALGDSLNGVFARLALRHLSPEELRSTAWDLGFGSPIPIDVPLSQGHVHIPSDPLGMARAAAGFWNAHISPVTALYAMQTIANRGERIRLHLLMNEDGSPISRESLGYAMSPSTADALRSMLERTVERGTCAKVFRNSDGSRALGGLPVAAKTGTLIGGHPTRMFSWFAAFAPSRTPQVAVTVLLADEVSWWVKANTVGRQVLEAYFQSSEAGPTSTNHGRREP